MCKSINNEVVKLKIWFFYCLIIFKNEFVLDVYLIKFCYLICIFL